MTCGAGQLWVDSASTLEVSAASENVVFAGGGPGNLVLDTAARFTGSISGLALGDAITFGNETVVSAVVAGGTLTVQGSAGTTRFQISGALTGSHFAVQSDAHTLKLMAGIAKEAAAEIVAAAIAAPVASRGVDHLAQQGHSAVTAD